MSYLYIGDQLRERIAVQVPALIGVVSVADYLADYAKTPDQRTPLVYVVYAGEDVLKTARDGKSTQVRQYWDTVLVARNLRQGEAAGNEDASPLLTQLQDALAGFQVTGCLRGVERSGRSTPNYLLNATEFPLRWAVDTNV